LLREYFPEGTDITGDIHYLQVTADEINDQPRAALRIQGTSSSVPEYRPR
jgi:IS30 family transposase